MPAFNRIQWEGKVMDLVLRTGEELEEIYRRHADTVYRVCFSFMKNPADTEDMVQETFLRLLSSGKAFSSREHEKAWLIVTAANACKDALKRWWRRSEDLSSCRCVAEDAPFAIDGVLGAILALPPDYKEAVYLYYYEGLTVAEAAAVMKANVSTVQTWLLRARERLRRELVKKEESVCVRPEIVP